MGVNYHAFTTTTPTPPIPPAPSLYFTPHLESSRSTSRASEVIGDDKIMDETSAPMFSPAGPPVTSSPTFHDHYRQPRVNHSSTPARRTAQIRPLFKPCALQLGPVQNLDQQSLTDTYRAIIVREASPDRVAGVTILLVWPLPYYCEAITDGFQPTFLYVQVDPVIFRSPVPSKYRCLHRLRF